MRACHRFGRTGLSANVIDTRCFLITCNVQCKISCRSYGERERKREKEFAFVRSRQILVSMHSRFIHECIESILLCLLNLMAIKRCTYQTILLQCQYNLCQYVYDKCMIDAHNFPFSPINRNWLSKY